MTRPITRRGALLAAVAASTAVLPGRTARGQAAARIVVPYPPGGTTDVTARLISPRASERLGQTWVIDNRSGANGAIGAESVARGAPDGQFLLYSNEVLLVLRFVQRGVPFDVVRDFTPVVRTVTIPYVLVGAPQHVREPDAAALIAAVRRSPDKFGFAGSTLGSVGHLGAAALGRKLGAELLVVPYRGTAPAAADVMAGSVQLMFAPLGAVAPMIRGGRLKAFATTSERRLSLMPEVPTLAESGFPDLVFEGWTGIWGPKGLPAETVARVHQAATAAADEPEVAGRIRDLGCEPLRESPAEFARLIEREAARNAEIVAAAGIKPE